MKPMRPQLDVSRLPTVAFGAKDIMWWGAVGFAVIEGTTLALCVMSLFYLRQNFDVWPPFGTPRPDLLVPTISTALMVASCVPAYLSDKAARALNKQSTRLWLVVCSVLLIIILVLQWYSLWALNTRWDTNAYGSVVWTTVGFHVTLLVIQAGETFGSTAALFKTELRARTAGDVSDAGTYWFFVMLVWVPLYAIVYLLPYVRR
jgi:cytochrome c oxidase subunit III